MLLLVCVPRLITLPAMLPRCDLIDSRTPVRCYGYVCWVVLPTRLLLLPRWSLLVVRTVAGYRTELLLLILPGITVVVTLRSGALFSPRLLPGYRRSPRLLIWLVGYLHLVILVGLRPI